MRALSSSVREIDDCESKHAVARARGGGRRGTSTGAVARDFRVFARSHLAMAGLGAQQRASAADSVHGRFGHFLLLRRFARCLCLRRSRGARALQSLAPAPVVDCHALVRAENGSRASASVPGTLAEHLRRSVGFAARRAAVGCRQREEARAAGPMPSFKFFFGRRWHTSSGAVVGCGGEEGPANGATAQPPRESGRPLAARCSVRIVSRLRFAPFSASVSRRPAGRSEGRAAMAGDRGPGARSPRRPSGGQGTGRLACACAFPLRCAGNSPRMT